MRGSACFRAKKALSGRGPKLSRLDGARVAHGRRSVGHIETKPVESPLYRDHVPQQTLDPAVYFPPTGARQRGFQTGYGVSQEPRTTQVYAEGRIRKPAPQQHPQAGRLGCSPGVARTLLSEVVGY